MLRAYGDPRLHEASGLTEAVPCDGETRAGPYRKSATPLSSSLDRNGQLQSCARDLTSHLRIELGRLHKAKRGRAEVARNTARLDGLRLLFAHVAHLEQRAGLIQQ
jgi:hypothetical protein